MDEKYNDPNGCMQSMAKKMKDKFDKYWGDCNLLIAMAAVLDPRNKMELIQWSFPLIYSTVDSIDHVAKVRESLRMLYREYLETHRFHNVEKGGQGESQREASSSSSGMSSNGRVRCCTQFYSYGKNELSVVEQVKSELDVYLEEGVHIYEGFDFQYIRMVEDELS